MKHSLLPTPGAFPELSTGPYPGLAGTGLWKEGPNLHLHPPKEQGTAEEEDTEGKGAENFLFSSQSLHHMPGSGHSRLTSPATI